MYIRALPYSYGRRESVRVFESSGDSVRFKRIYLKRFYDAADAVAPRSVYQSTKQHKPMASALEYSRNFRGPRVEIQFSETVKVELYFPTQTKSTKLYNTSDW